MTAANNLPHSLSSSLVPSSDTPDVQDGVIKYRVENISSELTDLPQADFLEADFLELEAWRSQLYNLQLIGQYANGIGYGNLSRRGKDQNQNHSFYITATQTGHLPNLDISCYPQVVSYNPTDHSLKVKGTQLPSSEAPTHAAIYALHPKINTIFHIHSFLMWTRLLQGSYLATSADVEYGTPEMAREIARIYKSVENIFERNVFVMAGHTDGIFAFGQDANQAGSAILRIYNELR
jgi:L-ribulose-5-phosphate 4-epimerase